MYLGENKESSLDFSKFKGIFLTINLNKNKICLFSSWIWASYRGIIVYMIHHSFMGFLVIRCNNYTIKEGGIIFLLKKSDETLKNTGV